MKRKDWLREKARQDFIDDLKEKCVRCGKWRIVNKEGFCDSCIDKEIDDEYGYVKE